MENLQDTSLIPGQPGDSNIEYIAFSGGGVAGAAYAGVLEAMDELGLRQNVKCYSGASIGAVVAVLAAGGMSGKRARECFMNFKGEDIVSIPSAWTAVFRSFSVLNDYGLNTIEKSSKWFLDIFREIGITENTTFYQFFRRTKIKVVIAVASITTYETYYFSWTSSPHFPIIRAIEFSISYPFVFKPMKYKDDLVVDGGMLDNLPIGVYDLVREGKIYGYNRKAVGFLLEPWDDNGENVANIVTYAARIATCISTALQYKMIEHPYEKSRICKISTEKLQTFSLSATNEQLERVADVGKEVSMRFFKHRLEQDPLPRNLFMQTYEQKVNKDEPYTNDYIVDTQMDSQYLCSMKIYRQNSPI